MYNDNGQKAGISGGSVIQGDIGKIEYIQHTPARNTVYTIALASSTPNEAMKSSKRTEI